MIYVSSISSILVSESEVESVTTELLIVLTPAFINMPGIFWQKLVTSSWLSITTSTEPL